MLSVLLFVLNWPGYGLKCHRAIKAAAELMGIKDLHCKVEGSTKNVQAVIRAFFDALIHQVWTPQTVTLSCIHCCAVMSQELIKPPDVSSADLGFTVILLLYLSSFLFVIYPPSSLNGINQNRPHAQK